MEDFSMNELKQRVQEYYRTEETIDAIALVEDEIDDIVTLIFNESEQDKNEDMEGNAQILNPTKCGFWILTDEGQKLFMHNRSYKGTHTDNGTRIQCGKFKVTSRGLICIDAQECLSLNELKYRMFSFIEEWDMVRASSAAWAIYKDASPLNQEKMRYCIHSLRNYIKAAKLRIAC